MGPRKLKSLRVQVTTAFYARIEQAVEVRRAGTSNPISSKAQAIREAISEWLDRQAA